MKKILTLVLGILASGVIIHSAIAGGIKLPAVEGQVERRPSTQEIENLRQSFRDDPHTFACVNDDGTVFAATVGAATPEQIAAAEVNKQESATVRPQPTWANDQQPSSSQIVPPGLPCEDPL